jgi:hypothetical protein
MGRLPAERSSEPLVAVCDSSGGHCPVNAWVVTKKNPASGAILRRVRTHTPESVSEKAFEALHAARTVGGVGGPVVARAALAAQVLLDDRAVVHQLQPGRVARHTAIKKLRIVILGFGTW